MIARTIFISLSRPSSHQARSPLPNSTPAATHLRQVYDRRTLSVLIKALVELMMLVIVHELRKGGLIQLAKNVAEFFVRIAPSGELLPVNLAQSAHESVAVLLAQLTIPVPMARIQTGLHHLILTLTLARQAASPRSSSPSATRRRKSDRNGIAAVTWVIVNSAEYR